MSEASTTDSAGAGSDRANKLLFWGCFIALVTTAFAFTSRMFLINVWAGEFDLDAAQAGRLAGIGIWPFAVSIILFSLFIDKIGYKVSMIAAFVGHVIWAVMAVAAYLISHEGGELVADEDTKKTAFNLLYWGSLICALANGTVEAFINPVVATMFNKEKTKWLNILHAGWPGGLVIAGVIVIFMGNASWGIKVGIIAVPAVVYLLMLLPRQFPVHERVASGVTYKQMLGEFGILGALIVGFLITLQLIDFAGPEIGTGMKTFFVVIGVGIVVAFGLYTRAMGRALLFVLVLIMIPLATTEIGTDGWITGIMEGVFEMSAEEVTEAGGPDKVLMLSGKSYSMHPGWVLVYTSVIMMILRFFAGPIIHKLSPLGLLMVSAALAIVGLAWLSTAAAGMIFLAATVYALGKTFFWPTMLGVVSEQTPKGGALTLNAISGIGMLAVGTLGFPYIGSLQSTKQIEAIAQNEAAQAVPGLIVDGKLTAIDEKSIYEIISYEAPSDDGIKAAIDKLPEAKRAKLTEQIAKARGGATQGALFNMALFPIIMLIGYIGLLLYFRSRGGYKVVELESVGGDGSGG
jgi:MFS family permease